MANATDQKQPKASGPNQSGAGTEKKKNDETPAARFVRLANRRVQKALTVLGHIANLGNRRVYEYTPEQTKKIREAIQAAATKVYAAFDGQAPTASGFSL